MKRCFASLMLLFVLACAGAESLDFSEFYSPGILGLEITAKTQSLSGKSASVVGFMAPPLKARGNFFVLSRNPVTLCPFCNSDADWPADIIVVYLKSSETFRQLNRPLVVTGTLEVGSFTDPDTGFVSLLRLTGASYKEK